jgi:hypothetical protein
MQLQLVLLVPRHPAMWQTDRQPSPITNACSIANYKACPDVLLHDSTQTPAWGSCGPSELRSCCCLRLRRCCGRPCSPGATAAAAATRGPSLHPLLRPLICCILCCALYSAAASAALSTLLHAHRPSLACSLPASRVPSNKRCPFQVSTAGVILCIAGSICHDSQKLHKTTCVCCLTHKATCVHGSGCRSMPQPTRVSGDKGSRATDVAASTRLKSGMSGLRVVYI